MTGCHWRFISKYENLDGPAVSALRRAIAKVKQSWSVVGWVTKNLLSLAPPFFERQVKQLVPAAFAVVSTHLPAMGPRGGSWSVLLACATAVRIYRLMMMMMMMVQICNQPIE
jgi:hypothetical protein